jgi:nitrogen regulatory protein P-II 1
LAAPERGETVQLISAIVRPAKVVQICDALQAFGFHGLTVSEASGLGKQRGHAEIYRGTEYASAFEHKTKIEIVARDEDVGDMIEVICKVAATGRMGDGKIWVTPVRELVRIRTKEAGNDAL